MKIINLIPPLPAYPILTSRIKNNIDYVVDYYQRRDELASNGIRVPKFLFKNTWPDTQHVEDIIRYVSFRTGLIIFKVDRAFNILMERKSIETISEYLESIPKNGYLIYLKGLEIHNDYFLLEELMEDNNNLVIATGRTCFYNKGFELVDTNTLGIEEEEVVSLITSSLESNLCIDVKQEVIEEVRLLFNEFKSVLVRKDSADGVIDMGAVSEGINKIKKSMYELYR